MVATLAGWLVVATESGIPTSDWRTQLAVPLGLIFFVGPIFLLLRSNLGTRRAHYVLGVTVFGFMTILGLFWSFGAPGTPRGVGPTNLPGQQANAYQPTWTAFAVDSLVAQDPRFSAVRSYPEGFGPVPEGFGEEAAAGATDIQTFFASEAGAQVISDTAIYDPAAIRYTEATNGYPIIAVPYQPVNDEGEPEGEPVVLFGFFDAGSPIFPSLVVLGISFVLFALYAFLLDRDEQRTRRERVDEAVPERERVPAGA